MFDVEALGGQFRDRHTGDVEGDPVELCRVGPVLLDGFKNHGVLGIVGELAKFLADQPYFVEGNFVEFRNGFPVAVFGERPTVLHVEEIGDFAAVVALVKTRLVFPRRFNPD